MILHRSMYLSEVSALGSSREDKFSNVSKKYEYLQNMQNECFTPFKQNHIAQMRVGASKGVGGRMNGHRDSRSLVIFILSMQNSTLQIQLGL